MYIFHTRFGGMFHSPVSYQCFIHRMAQCFSESCSALMFLLVAKALVLLVHSGVTKKWRCVVAASDSSITRGELNPRLGVWNYTFFVWPMARVSVLPMFMSFVLASPLCSFCALMFHTMFHTCFIPPCHRCPLVRNIH